jgi:Domain of unknown function (DUF4395)
MTVQTNHRPFGIAMEGLLVDGRSVTAGVFNEHQVRAAAGLTMVIGAVAFVYAYFAKQYLPIQLVTTFFFVEFLMRVTLGLQFSPVGQVAKLLALGQAPHWVSAKPKRFAWSLGLVMSLGMAVITNSGIRGALPLTICLICLTLMWLEAVLGLCIGCELHGYMVRRGWVAKDAAFEICSRGACTVNPGSNTRSGTTSDDGGRP